MSDLVFVGHGDDAVRYGLVVMQCVAIWGALHYYLAGRHLKAR